MGVAPLPMNDGIVFGHALGAPGGEELGPMTDFPEWHSGPQVGGIPGERCRCTQSVAEPAPLDLLHRIRSRRWRRRSRRWRLGTLRSRGGGRRKLQSVHQGALGLHTLFIRRTGSEVESQALSCFFKAFDAHLGAPFPGLRIIQLISHTRIKVVLAHMMNLQNHNCQNIYNIYTV